MYSNASKPIIRLLATATLMAWANANAATTVCGIVAGETWTAAGSPYRVECDVFVLGLTIKSNVIVEFAGDYEFEVAGGLEVMGASNAPVYFTPGTTNGWGGILFRDAVPGSYFTHTIIEGSKNSGVRITNTPPAFTNCMIRDNTSPGHGGGILADVSGGPLVMQGCLITSNVAGPFNSGDIYGGGIFVADGDCVFKRCRIVGNSTQGRQGYGGGVFLHADSCIMQNCEIIGNIPRGTAVHYADGIYFNGGTLEMFNCVVATNGVPGAGGYGGGLWAYGGNAKVWNCLFLGNAHQGMYCGAGSATLSVVNCTVVGNVHQGLYQEGGSACVTNSIFYFNYAASADRSAGQIGGTACIVYSDVEGGVRPGSGNISFAPALCPQNQSLIRGSPCIDTGHPDPSFYDICIDDTLCTTNSRGSLRNDMGAYGGPAACNWTPGEEPVIVKQPGSLSSCLDGTATFSVGARGEKPLRYQWSFNGIAISGQTNTHLSLTNLQAGDAGVYSVMVSNVFGIDLSVPANLIVHDACMDIRMYAGLDISGQQGATYELRYTSDLNNTNFATWAPLGTNVMTTSGWFYLDRESPFSPKRFYGVKKLQP